MELIMFGKDPKYFMPGAYIQFVRFKGNDNGGAILNERRFEGCLYKMLPQLESFIRDGIVTKRPVPISILREKDVKNYPYKALRELLMNAVMRRDYQSNMPTRLYQYDKHIEIMNLFNHGITDVQDQLKANNSPAAEFNTGYVTAFSAIVREPDMVGFTMNGKVDEKAMPIDYQEFIKELYQNFTNIDKVDDKVVMLMFLLLRNEGQVSVKEMMEACNIKSRMTFDRTVLRPFLDAGLIVPLYPQNPRHPKQKYTMTKTGLEWLEKMKNRQSHP